MKLFKKNKKLEHKHLLELAAACAGAMLLIFAALFISGGGVARLEHSIAINGISPGSLIATIFPCSYFGYCYAPIVVNPGMSVSNAAPTPGSTVTAYPTVSSSGASGQCYQYQYGGEYGAGWNQYGTGGDWLCTCVGGDQDGSIVACGTGGSQCDSTVPAYTTGTTAVGGYTQIWTNGGPIPAWTTLPVTQAGTTYTVLNYCFFANVGYQTGGASATITPVNPAPTCPVSSFGSPWSSSSYLIYSGGRGSISNWYGRYCVTNYSGSAIFIPMATPTEWNNFSAAAAGIGVGIVAY